MIHTNKLIKLIHVLPWAYAAMMFLWELTVAGQPVRPRSLCIGIYVYYGHLYVFQRYVPAKRYRLYGGYLAFILLTAQLPYLLFGLVRNLPFPPTFYLFTPAYWTETFFFLFNSVVVAGIALLTVKTIVREQILKQAVTSELVYLKSQINPHFLFNTLNNIHTLVYIQAPVASEAVMRLSSLMRYMLYESNAATVPVTTELNYLNDYIGLQQLRYASPNVVDFRVEGDIERSSIAPLLFIHLLENSYKHSPAELPSGSIQVSVLVKGLTLSFHCENPLSSQTDNFLGESGGIGLANLRKRLSLLYRDRYRLAVHRDERRFRVEMEIPVEE